MTTSNKAQKPEVDLAALYRLYDAAPDDALLDENVVAAVHGCSVAKLQRDRWAGTGLPFVRCGGRMVRYRKSTVRQALASLAEVGSTTAA